MMLVMLPAFVWGQYTLGWARAFGGDGWDEANTCIETRDGDYMVSGFVKHQQHNMWIVKMRRNGEGRWGKIFADYYISACNSMIQTADSNIVVTGYAVRKREFQSNLLLMKIDTLGNVLWHKVYGGDGDEQGLSVIETHDGGYAVAGFTSSNQDADPNWYIIKVDSNGNLLWEKQFGSSNDDRALSIAQTYDDGFVITGYIGTPDGGRKLMSLVKLDNDGNDEWTQWYYINEWCAGTSVIATRDSMIVAAGYTKAFTITDYDVLLMKTDMQGDTIWTRTFGDEDWQEGTGVIEAYDNTFVVSGFSSSNKRDQSSFLMMKYDGNGNLLWHDAFKRKSQDYAKSIVETRDNGILLAGTTFSFGKGWDMAVLKMDNVERTEMKFTFPTDSLCTTMRNKIDFTLCLKSFGIPNNVKVFVNDKLQVTDSEFRKPTEDEKAEGCDFPLSYTVALTPGANVVRLEIRDYKNYIFDKQFIVYQLPKYEFVR